jgi:uncharacterized protein (TIGR02677 family)
VSPSPGPGRIEVFAYITDDYAPLYRAIMRAFVQSKDRFVLKLRLPDVVAAIGLSGICETSDPEQTDAALTRLCEWGHLQKDLEVRDVLTVEDFFAQHYVFRLTAQGEALEESLALFDTASDVTYVRENELDATALSDIRRLLEDLLQLSILADPDAMLVHCNMLLLQARFKTVTATAQALMERLESEVGSQSADGQQLFQYGERFVAELVLTVDAIGRAVHDLEPSSFERLIRVVARRSVHDSIEMKSHWDRFRRWFISDPGRPSHAELIRERARPLITAGLSAIARANDRRIHRIDRASDFRVLARWFAQAESDAVAHRLWRSAFGLCPARHLIVNDRTLDDHETRDVPANTSWLDAPPLRISKRFRHDSNSPQTGMLSRIIDRTADKEKLAAATHEEALRLLRAQNRFGTGRRMRLSELEQLETGEFDMLLDLLGEAVSARVFTNEAVEALSPDGSLSVRLEPTDDGRNAMILTNDGIFSGPDQWIQIDPISTETVESRQC